jgi:hypothetical protein
MTTRNKGTNDRNREATIRKVIGIALAMLFTLTLAAAAEEGTGRSFVLDNGTKVTASEKQISDLTPGEPAKAMFETQGGKVVSAEPRAIDADVASTHSWLPKYGTEIDSIQAE